MNEHAAASTPISLVAGAELSTEGDARPAETPPPTVSGGQGGGGAAPETPPATLTLADAARKLGVPAKRLRELRAEHLTAADYVDGHLTAAGYETLARALGVATAEKPAEKPAPEPVVQARVTRHTQNRHLLLARRVDTQEEIKVRVPRATDWRGGMVLTCRKQANGILWELFGKQDRRHLPTQ